MQPIKTDRWLHRRRMSYSALVALVSIAAGAFCVEISTAQGALLEGVAMVLGVIVGTYVGIKTWVEKNGNTE